MRRIYHPWWKWEEVKYNMWGTTINRNEWLQKAIKLTKNHKLYGKWMIKVSNDWKYSCEHNLTAIDQNRRAWIGHAAVAYAIQCPEDIVREAWGYLTDSQRQLANNEADKVILFYERKNIRIYQNMGTQMLFKWNPRGSTSKTRTI